MSIEAVDPQKVVVHVWQQTAAIRWLFDWRNLLEILGRPEKVMQCFTN